VKSPIFVVGCHRSGTNLLYDMLLSAGGLAVYRGILPVYEKLIPRFGTFDNVANREKAVGVFLRSQGFRRSGLAGEQIRAALLAQCRTGGDFLRIIMDAVARAQSVSRWAVYNPDNLLRILTIKREMPDALFVHIIRDGRDIALSLSKMGGFVPLPWDRTSRSLTATALYWEWMVQHGRRQGRSIGADYFEVRYEDLVSAPKPTLDRLGRFLEHDLNYDRIQNRGLGRLSESNSSFKGEQTQGSPLNRWKEKLSPEQVVTLERAVGECLTELGYPLATADGEHQKGLRERGMRLVYSSFLGAKLWLKSNTPAGRLSSLSELELQDSAAEEESTRAR